MSATKRARPIRIIVLLLTCQIAFASTIGCAPRAPLVQLEHAGANTSAITAAFSWDDRLVAAANARGFVRVWDARSGAALAECADFATPSGYQRHAVDFSPDGSVLAFATNDGVCLWKWRSGGRKMLAGHRVAPTWVSFAGDGELIAISGGYQYSPHTHLATREPLVVTAWDARSGELLHRVEDDSSGGLNSVASPSGDRYVANCIEGVPRRFSDLTKGAHMRPSLKLCETATGRVIAAEDLSRGALYMSFSPDGELLFTSLLGVGGNGVVRDARSLRVIRTVNVSRAVFSTDGKRLIALQEAYIRRFHPALLLWPVLYTTVDWEMTTVYVASGRESKGQIRLREQDSGGSEPLAFSHDRQFVVDGQLRIWTVPK